MSTRIIIFTALTLLAGNASLILALTVTRMLTRTAITRLTHSKCMRQRTRLITRRRIIRKHRVTTCHQPNRL